MKCTSFPHYKARRGKFQAVSLFFALIFFLAALAFFLFPFLRTKKEVILPQKDYYALVFYRGKDASSALSAAEALSLRGGAGFLREREIFTVYGCVYAEKSAAVRAQSAILKAETECTLEKISLPAVYAKKKSSSSDKSAILALQAAWEKSFFALAEAYPAADRGEERAVILSSLSAAAETCGGGKREFLRNTALSEGVRAAAVSFLEGMEKQLSALTGETSLYSLSVEVKRVMLRGVFDYAFCLKMLGNG